MRALLTGLGWRLPLCLLLAAASVARAGSFQAPETGAWNHPGSTPPGVSIELFRPGSQAAETPFPRADGNACQGHRLAERKGDKDHHKGRGRDDPAFERGRGPGDDRLLPAERKKLEERRRRFQELPPQEQRRLLEARERFRHLPPEERARLREKWRQLPPEERRRWRESGSEPEH